GRRLVRQYLALDAAVLHCRKVIARRPYPRGELLAEQIILGGKAFEGDVPVAIELVAYHVVIKEAATDREVDAPPILDALEFDIAVDLELADLVGAAAERNIESGF